MATDNIFRDKKDAIMSFDFGKETAKVFDDMLERSVPFYAEIQKMIGEISSDFAQEGTNLYDLGCSTCNTFLAIDKRVPRDVTFIGIDSSEEMLKKGGEKLVQSGMSRKVELKCEDLNKGVSLKNASVVIMNLTLQFVRPLYRQQTIKTVSAGLNEGGCFILIEKVLSPNSTINRMFIKHYYEFKKSNGYSELEIAQKREALENILVPYHFDENRELLLSNGFKACEMFFRWYNFCGTIALK